MELGTKIGLIMVGGPAIAGVMWFVFGQFVGGCVLALTCAMLLITFIRIGRVIDDYNPDVD